MNPNIMKSHRVRINKTQQEVASFLNVTLRTFVAKENNPEKFTLKELEKLKDLYQLNSIDVLIYGFQVHKGTHEAI